MLTRHKLNIYAEIAVAREESKCLESATRSIEIVICILSRAEIVFCFRELYGL